MYKLWRALRDPAPRTAAGALIGGGIILGIILWGGFNSAIRLSNTETFCISCHEMESTVFEELKKTSHYNNNSGVRATCPDCHVPKEWLFKVGRKIQATFHELPYHLIGVIDTREKFEERRLDMAKRVWRSMEKTDSRECRNCHQMSFMDIANQTQRAKTQHEDSFTTGETCIDCHKGIAHKAVHKELEAPAEEEEGGFVLE